MSSPAWMLRGISAIPGALELRGSVLSFVAHDTGTAWDWQLRKLERQAGRAGIMDALKDDRPAVLFREARTDIRVRCPWYYFSGGIVVQIGRQTYRLSFGRPARSSGSEEDELQSVSHMRRVGKQWLRALGVE